jgi:hypothetical protein
MRDLTSTFNYNPSGYLASIVDVKSFFRVVWGGNRLPINPPLYFLRDLYLIFLFIPLIHIFTKSWKNVWVPIAFALFFNFKSAGIYIPLEDFKAGIMNRADMILFFTLGYFIARMQISIPKPGLRVSSGLFIVYISVLIAVAVALIHFKLAPIIYLKLRFVVGLLSVVFVPVFISLMLYFYKGDQAKGWLAKYSFTLFLTHILFAHVVTMVIMFNRNISISINSPLLNQIIYLVVYLGGCVLLAVVLRHFWVFVKSGVVLGLSGLFKVRT